MFGRIIGVLLSILAIAAIGIGCGSGSDDTTGGGDGTVAASGETSGGETTDGETTDGDSGDGEATDGESGDGDGDREPVTISSKSIPKKKYIQEGDSICVGVPAEYQGLVGELPKKQQENDLVTVPKAAIPPLEKAIEKFAELGAPDGDQAKAEEVIGGLETAIEGLEEEPEGELSGPKSSFVEFNKVTKAMGFKSCSTL